MTAKELERDNKAFDFESAIKLSNQITAEQNKQDYSLTSEQVESLIKLFNTCAQAAIENRERTKEFGPSWNYYDGIVDGYRLARGAIEREIEYV